MTLSPQWRHRLTRSALARIVIFAILAVALFLLTTLVVRALGWTADDAPRWARITSFFLRQTVTTIGAYLVLVFLIEKRRPDELAPRKILPHGAAGLAGGTLLVGGVVGMLWLAGCYRVVGFGDDVRWVNGLLLTGLGTAIAEEIVFRGVLFRISEEGLGFGWALAISALFFGGLHIGNPGATLWTSFAIAVEAGVLLGVVYHVTRSLPVCMGVHMAWNFLEGTVFGSAVSGTAAKTSWLIPEISGPLWLTGGSFGIEGSVLTVAFSLIGSIALLAARRRRASDNVAIAAGVSPC